MNQYNHQAGPALGVFHYIINWLWTASPLDFYLQISISQSLNCHIVFESFSSSPSSSSSSCRSPSLNWSLPPPRCPPEPVFSPAVTPRCSALSRRHRLRNWSLIGSEAWVSDRRCPWSRLRRRRRGKKKRREGESVRGRERKNGNGRRSNVEVAGRITWSSRRSWLNRTVDRLAGFRLCTAVHDSPILRSSSSYQVSPFILIILNSFGC